MDTLAKRFHWTRSSTYRVLSNIHPQRLPEQRPNYIYHPSFDDPSQEAAILAPMPGAEAYEAQCRQMKVPEDVPPELAPLYTPLLSKEQEQHLFRQMNFLKHQATRLRDLLRLPGRRIDLSEARTRNLIDRLPQKCAWVARPESSKGVEPVQSLHALRKAPERATQQFSVVGLLDTIENLQRQAQAVKALLFNSNMRLLVAIAKRYATRARSFSELLSDGNMPLISAVEKFDYSRGNKFSTYASWVIMKNYARSIVKEKHHRQRYLTGHEEWFFEAAVDTRSDEKACLASAEQARACINRLLQLLEFLDPRERQIIRLRLGLDNNAKRKTLENIGKYLGVTKERVRQLQERAMKKLRNLAAANSVELP